MLPAAPETTVPGQALFFLNHPLLLDRASPRWPPVQEPNVARRSVVVSTPDPNVARHSAVVSPPDRQPTRQS
ncbi:MAG: hypothetical protein R3C56_32815 [Pirellulaceae bacterium]